MLSQRRPMPIPLATTSLQLEAAAVAKGSSSNAERVAIKVPASAAPSSVADRAGFGKIRRQHVATALGRPVRRAEGRVVSPVCELELIGAWLVDFSTGESAKNGRLLSGRG